MIVDKVWKLTNLTLTETNHFPGCVPIPPHGETPCTVVVRCPDHHPQVRSTTGGLHGRRVSSIWRPFQGYPRSIPSIPFYFNSCLKATLIYPPASYRKHLLRDAGAPWFMFSVYGFDLSERVSLVMTLTRVVPCVFATILAVTPYIPFCMYNLPNRSMMCVVIFVANNGKKKKELA
jgi:hypothetical protein